MVSPLNAGQVRVAGTGAFWKAPLGTVLPTDSTTAWNAAFVNLGFATDGFTMKQDFKTKEVTGWQTLELLRLIPIALNRSFTFELQQSNKDTLALAWGGAAITPASVSLGTVAIVASTGVLTVSATHGLVVNDPIQLGTITGTTGVVAGTTYYVKTAPTGTTLTLSATVGGAALVLTTDGSAASIIKVTGAYSLAIPDASTIANFIIGIDWSDGATSQRLIIQRAALTSLPAVKSTRSDSIAYVTEVQALKPADGTSSVLVYGVDTAVGS